MRVPAVPAKSTIVAVVLNGLLVRADAAAEDAVPSPVVVVWVEALVLPLLAGWLIGRLLRVLARGRVSGALTMFGLLALPAAGGIALARFPPDLFGPVAPSLGTWDGFTEGLLVGAALCCTAHGAFRDARRVGLMVASFVGGLLLLEGATRVFLRHAPGFADKRVRFLTHIDDGRAKDPVLAGPQARVCRLAYPSLKPDRAPLPGEPDYPVRMPPGHAVVNPRRRVVHIGDSMTFGFGVTAEETFEANLERLEPQVEHLNAGIIGTAPDDYLINLRSWLEKPGVDLAVIYLFEGNDLGELDLGHPCSAWQSILTYGPTGAALRFPDGPHFSHPVWETVRGTSPPPFLLHTLVDRSDAAAFLVSAILHLNMPDLNAIESESVRFEHLEALLRTARDEARARGVALAIVVLPSDVDDPDAPPDPTGLRMLEVARHVGLPTLDPAGAVHAANRRGEKLRLGRNDGHFNVAGHQLLAQWLHDNLAVAVALPSSPKDSGPESTAEVRESGR